MPNEDRISEVYRGEIWSEKDHQNARERIHWMCSRASGRVLDLGCSQGIASIIVGREGLAVAGVDHELSRLVQGQEDLAREDPWVRKRVGFLAAEGRELPFADAAFDTVLMGEVLEHLVLPDLLLTEVGRVLNPGGRLLVTTPAGYHPYHDHKRSFLPVSLARLLAERFRLDELELTEHFLLAVAHRPVAGEKTGGAEEAILVNQDALESRVIGLEKELRKTILHHRTEVQKARGRAHAEVQAKQSYRKVSDTLRDRLSKVESEASGARATNARLRRQLEATQERLERTRWWLELERSRRSWRFGHEIAKAWPHPGRLLLLPLRLVKVLVTRVPPPPRPEERTGDGTETEPDGQTEEGEVPETSTAGGRHG